MSKPVLSVLIPISDRHDDLQELYTKHSEILHELELSYEFIFVLDGNFPEAGQSLKVLQKEYSDTVKTIIFNKTYGEAKALSAAFAESSGNQILTLPAYFQVQPDEIKKLFKQYSPEVDLLVGCRWPRRDNLLNKIQAKVFHALISKLTKESLADISCGVRLMRREVLEKINIYGDMHRFIPLLAMYKGFRAQEIHLKQAEEDKHLRVYRPGVYLRRVLDILTLFFLIKFTQKPLRFFGLLGSGLSGIGVIITLLTVFQRLIGNTALSDRPLFLGGILFLLVGLQIFFIGLVAEIIIFTHTPEEPMYNVEQILE